jgi:hypothetical protein
MPVSDFGEPPDQNADVGEDTRTARTGVVGRLVGVGVETDKEGVLLRGIAPADFGRGRSMVLSIPSHRNLLWSIWWLGNPAASKPLQHPYFTERCAMVGKMLAKQRTYMFIMQPLTIRADDFETFKRILAD